MGQIRGAGYNAMVLFAVFRADGVLWRRTTGAIYRRFHHHCLGNGGAVGRRRS